MNPHKLSLVLCPGPYCIDGDVDITLLAPGLEMVHLVWGPWVLHYHEAIFTPHTCARGKAIGFVCLSVVCECRHKNRQISSSRHLCVL